MKRLGIITFIAAMIMLSVGCSTDGQTTKAEPGIFEWCQYTIPIAFYEVDMSTEAPEIIYVGTNFSEIVYSNVDDNSIRIPINDEPLSGQKFISIWDEPIIFVEKPDIINFGTNINMKNIRLHSYLPSLPTPLSRGRLLCKFG